jgi:hypothetical protein
MSLDLLLISVNLLNKKVGFFNRIRQKKGVAIATPVIIYDND